MVVAASAVVTDSEGRVLLQRWRDNDLWALPGGGMDLGDSLPGTAVAGRGRVGSVPGRFFTCSGSSVMMDRQIRWM